MAKATPNKRPAEPFGALPAYCDALQKSLADVQSGDIAQAIRVWQHHAANLAAIRDAPRPPTKKLIECKGLAECLLDRLHTAANDLLGRTAQRLIGDSTQIYQSGLICKRLCQDWDRWKSGTVVLWPGCIGDNVDRLPVRERIWVRDSEPQLERLRLALSELSGGKGDGGRGQVDNTVDKKKLSTIGFTQAARKCAKTYKAKRQKGEKITMKAVILDYIDDNPGTSYSYTRKSLSAHPKEWKVDTKVDKAVR
jgi:hypothetical protein